MFYISDIRTDVPRKFNTTLQAQVYKTLKELHIAFERVDTDEIITMEECVRVNKALEMDMVKTLFLCDRQQTEFYLFVTTANKPFKTKEFSSILSLPRLSFAPAELLKKVLGTDVGAATIFGVLQDKNNLVKVIIDEDVVSNEWYGCSDGTRTVYMKIKTAQIVEEFLSHAQHSPTIIRYMLDSSNE